MNLSTRSDSSFESLLERFVHDYSDRFGLPVRFEVAGSIPPLPARTQAELLRIAMEALTNVKRHATAAHANVLVQAEDGVINLTVTDDGRGFDVDERRDSSFGLSSMRERAALIGGRLDIRSGPGVGTRIGVTAPIRLSVAAGGSA
jgi:signal transduction histidine kinase